MRIVLDTNVVLSGLLWRGAPYRLFQAIRQRDHVRLFASGELLEELAEVLIRPMLAKRIAMVGGTARGILADYIEIIDLVTPVVVLPVIAADPDDDHVVAAAVAAEADLIVSGDRHLLALRSSTHDHRSGRADGVMSRSELAAKLPAPLQSHR